MNQLTRFRLGNIIRYHEAVAEAAGKRLEPTPPRDEAEEGEEQQQAAEPQADPAYAEQQAIFDLHTEAAKQLREVLEAAPLVSGIDQALTNPRRILRNGQVMPSRKPGGFVSTGLIH
jgi:hypothetical protein